MPKVSAPKYREQLCIYNVTFTISKCLHEAHPKLQKFFSFLGFSVREYRELDSGAYKLLMVY